MPDRIRGRWVLLIDDVVTTGASAAAWCAGARGGRRGGGLGGALVARERSGRPAGRPGLHPRPRTSRPGEATHAHHRQGQERGSPGARSRVRGTQARTLDRVLDDRTGCHRRVLETRCIAAPRMPTSPRSPSSSMAGSCAAMRWGSAAQAALDEVVDKVERQAVDYKSLKPRVRARPRRKSGSCGPSPTAPRTACHRAANRQEQAVRHRADVRGGRDRRDGGPSGTSSTCSSTPRPSTWPSSTRGRMAPTGSSSPISSAASTPRARGRADGNGPRS